MTKKHKIGRGFCLWLCLGLALYIGFAGGYMLLANEYRHSVNVGEMLKNSEQITYTGRTLTTTGSDPKLFFDRKTEYDVNYIRLNISGLSKPNVNAGLYYSDTAGSFSQNKFTGFFLKNGVNEVRVKTGNYLRLDIADEEGISLTLDSVELRSAPSPIYELPYTLFVFAVSWIIAYLAAARMGIRYKGLRESAVVLLEGCFCFFIIMITVYALGCVRYKAAVYILAPLTVYAVAVGYSRLKNGNKAPAIWAAGLGLMTAAMCIVGYKMLSVHQTDLGIVYESAWQIAENGRVSEGFNGNDYFVRYHTNLPILAIFSVLYRVLSLFGLTAADTASNYISVLFNIAFIMAAVIFGMAAAKNLFGKKGALVYFVMSALFVPYYINANRFYTDTLSLPFTSLFLWLYSIEDKKFKSPYIRYALMGLVIGIGSVIKGSLTVIIVAVVMQLALKSIKNLRFAAAVVLTAAVISGIWGGYTKSCSWIDMGENDSLEFPLTHWVMMGINKDVMGGYSHQDFEYTLGYTTKAAKQRANIRLIKMRLAGFGGIGDFADYEFSRAADTWLDGQYMQDSHIGCGKTKGIVYDFLTEGRSFYKPYKAYIQMYSFCMLALAAIGGILSLRRPRADYAMFLRLAMLGTIFFFMLWESKSRYILNVTPVFMLAAIYGLEKIKESFLGGNDFEKDKEQEN